MSAPPLSVVVARTDPGLRIVSCLGSLLEQAQSIGAEIILAEGSVAPLSGYESDHLVRLREPGASVYRLRAIGMTRARGDIIALTEDHCRVADDWCESVLAAHRDHPDAGAIGGVVENGSTGSLLHWANFLVPNGHSLAPLHPGPSRRLPGSANLSFKRWAVPEKPGEAGIMECFFVRDLAESGVPTALDPRPRVIHDQAFDARTHLALHFHAGRSVAGFRVESARTGERLVRWLACPALPIAMLARTIAVVARKRRRDVTLWRSVPWMLALLASHAAGESIGYVFGYGESPARLH
jgi:hypothetical protein